MDSRELAGPVKVAILVQSMGREQGQAFLTRMGGEERGLVEKLISQMGPVAPELVEKIAKEFAELAVRSRSVQRFWSRSAAGSSPVSRSK